MINIIKLPALTIAIISVIGCSSNPTLQIGTEQSYANMKFHIEAEKTIVVYEDVPVGSKIIGAVKAQRCHRNTSSREPNEEVVLLDLKVIALEMGANGLAKVTYNTESGLLSNCFYILNGNAVAISKE